MNFYSLRRARRLSQIIRLRMDWLTATRDVKPHVWRNGGHDAADWFDDMLATMDQLREVLDVPKQTPKKVEWAGFVDIRLTADQIDAFQSWDIQDDDVWLGMAGDVQGGYKFTSAYNGQNDTFSASYTCNILGDPNAGYTLSAFGPDFYTACRMLLYKHHVVSNYNWTSYKSAPTTRLG